MKGQKVAFVIALLALVTFTSAFVIDLVDDSGKVQKIASEKELEIKLKETKEKLVVIDFFATWCKPCKEIAPIYEALAKATPNAVFLKVDVDEASDLADKYGVSGIPTFIFIRNSKRIDILIGSDAPKLRELVKKHNLA